MSDIFLSYKSEDRALIEPIAQALEAEGFNVWWDKKIPAGMTWRELIERQVKEAKVVVVAWSKRTESSADAAWVLNEVDLGARLSKKLMPVMLEVCNVPLGYTHIQAANLAGWRGDTTHPEWRDLVAGVRSALEAAGVPVPEPRALAAEAPMPKRRLALIGGGAALALALIGGGGYLLSQGGGGKDAPAAVAADAAAGADDQEGFFGEPQIGQAAPRGQEDFIASGFAMAEEDLTPQNGRLVGQAQRGRTLAAGAAATSQLRIPRGQPFTVRAFCDANCNDLDLKLASGRTAVDEDDTPGDSPIVSVAQAGAAPYALTVTMRDCSAPACEYGVVVYRGVAQRRAPLVEAAAAANGDVVAAQLADAAAGSLDEGWRSVAEPYRATLTAQQAISIPVTLEAGATYRFFAACDENCGDLDLYMRAGAQEVGDSAPDAQPKIEVKPDAAGSYQLQVSMYACRSETPCAFGVTMLRAP